MENLLNFVKGKRISDVIDYSSTRELKIIFDGGSFIVLTPSTDFDRCGYFIGTSLGIVGMESNQALVLDEVLFEKG